MPIRLSKVCREHNVSLAAIVAFFKQKSIDIENNQNV